MHRTFQISQPITNQIISFIDDRLKFGDHLAEKVNRANKLVGLITSTFLSLESDILRSLFTALVRPHLEYANQIWSPHLVKDVEILENVLRRATRLVPQLKSLSYEDRLRKVDLPTLSYRRSRGDMLETFKILSGQQDKDSTQGIFQMRTNHFTPGATPTKY